jgi:hypothetical protein
VLTDGFRVQIPIATLLFYIAHTAALDSRAASHKKLTTFDKTQTFGIISCEKGGSNPTMSTKINTIIVCLV